MQDQMITRKRSIRLAGLRTAILLAAATSGVFAYLGPELLRSALSAANSQELTPGDSPLAFDAPTWELARLKAGEKELGRPVPSAKDQGTDEVVLDDWSYTAIVRGHRVSSLRPTPSNRK